MAYTAWETGAGEALAEVESFCRHAARSNGKFSTSTVPTLAVVERWLTLSHAWISGLLANHGMNTSQTDPTVLAVLQSLNVCDVCVKVEMALPVEDTTGAASQRFQAFLDMRKELMDIITSGSISKLGATAGNSRAPFLGGRYESRKRELEEDKDATQHRVKRNQFRNPGTALPQGDAEAEEA